MLRLAVRQYNNTESSAILTKSSTLFMAETKKTREEKELFEVRLAVIRPDLPTNTGQELNSFCRYTQRDTFEAEHIYNVLRTPVRRYDDAILEAMEKMVKVNQQINA